MAFAASRKETWTVWLIRGCERKSGAAHQDPRRSRGSCDAPAPFGPRDPAARRGETAPSPSPGIYSNWLPMKICRGRGGYLRRQGAALPPLASLDLYAPSPLLCNAWRNRHKRRGGWGVRWNGAKEKGNPSVHFDPLKACARPRPIRSQSLRMTARPCSLSPASEATLGTVASRHALLLAPDSHRDQATSVVPAKAGTQAGGLSMRLDPGLRRGDSGPLRSLRSTCPGRTPAPRSGRETPRGLAPAWRRPGRGARRPATHCGCGERRCKCQASGSPRRGFGSAQRPSG